MVQRVERAEVRVEQRAVAQMGPGLLALVAVRERDGPRDALQLADKLVNMRVFRDSDGKMNESLLQVGAGLCVVSQFTLWGDLRKGRRPSYAAAAKPEHAEPLIEAVVAAARAEGVTVVTGKFRADMSVELVNDGPVTLLLDTERLF